MAKIINLTQGKETIVDDEDYDYLNQFKWHAVKKGTVFYVRTQINGKKVYLHRLLMKVNISAVLVDHKNRNPLDNRKENLRLCTKSTNAMNQVKRLNNTSGYKGVSWNSSKNLWESNISFNGNRKFLGYFKNKISAAKAYNKAAMCFHNEFARINSIGE